MILINLLWREQAEARSVLAGDGAARWLRDKRLRVFIRSRGRCVYCGSVKHLQADHAVPIKRGGSDEVQNLVVACRICNQRKAMKTAEEFGRPDVQVERPRETYSMFCWRYWYRR